MIQKGSDADEKDPQVLMRWIFKAFLLLQD